VPVTIAGLTGSADAGASGLINTSRQIGGPSGRGDDHRRPATTTTPTATRCRQPAALTHGFQVAFYALTAAALAGAAIAAAFLESRPKATPKAERVDVDVVLEPAA
jgi:hypothetical protein